MITAITLKTRQRTIPAKENITSVRQACMANNLKEKSIYV
jgi:hypothetical protein